MKEIKMTQNMVVVVDERDYEELSKYKWRSDGKYAIRISSLKLGKRRKIYMHVQIMGKIEGLEIDHINGNKLDNRRENLRHVTTAQNQQNARGKGGTSKYRGVCWNVNAKKWLAQIRINGEANYIGIYFSEKDAALEYNKAAELAWGEYARLNVLDG